MAFATAGPETFALNPGPCALSFLWVHRRMFGHRSCALRLIFVKLLNFLDMAPRVNPQGFGEYGLCHTCGKRYTTSITTKIEKHT